MLQEKPVGIELATPQELLREYLALPAGKPVWALAENYRSEEVFRRARQLAGQLGRSAPPSRFLATV